MDPTSLTVNEGSSKSYTVVLESEPTGDVVVSAARESGGSSDVGVIPASLTFTADDWDDKQTVTVSAEQDDDAENDSAVIGHTVSGGDYGSESASDVTVTVDDDETPAPELTLTLAEPAHGDEDSSGDVTLDDTLTYTAKVENTGNVALTGVEVSDLLIDSDGKECGELGVGESCELTGEYTVDQADVDAGEVTNTAVADAEEVEEKTVTRQTTVAQERSLGLVVSAEQNSYTNVGDEIEYSYEVSNSGTVTLTGTVEIEDDTVSSVTCASVPAEGLGPGGEVTCSGSYTVVQADLDAGEVESKATATLSGVTSGEQTVTVRWTRPAGQSHIDLVIAGAAGEESVGSLSFLVTLSAGHLQTVVVSYATSDGTATGGQDYTAETAGSLRLAPGATSGTISVGIVDDAVDEDEESFTVTLRDPGREGVNLKTAATTGTITDDDERGVEVDPTTLTVNEGDEGDESTYTVVLESEPTGSVVVTAARESGSPDVSVSPTSLTFTADDWDEKQTVTVSAGQDDDAVNDSAVIGHTVSGGDYGSASASDVVVTVDDDEVDSTGITLSVDPASVSEGAGATGVTVTVTASLNSGRGRARRR